MVSTTANNVIGAAGGGVLAACLVPQVARLYRTKSAYDLSYGYLVLYSTGLILTFVYLYFEGALVAWICMLVEIAFCLGVLLAKFYLDHWGPYSPRGKLKQASSKDGAARESVGEACRLCGSLYTRGGAGGGSSSGGSRRYNVSAHAEGSAHSGRSGSGRGGGSSDRGGSGSAHGVQLADMDGKCRGAGSTGDSGSGILSPGSRGSEAQPPAGTHGSGSRMLLEVRLPGLPAGGSPAAEQSRQVALMRALQAALAHHDAGASLSAALPGEAA